MYENTKNSLKFMKSSLQNEKYTPMSATTHVGIVLLLLRACAHHYLQFSLIQRHETKVETWR